MLIRGKNGARYTLIELLVIVLVTALITGFILPIFAWIRIKYDLLRQYGWTALILGPPASKANREARPENAES